MLDVKVIEELVPLTKSFILKSLDIIQVINTRFEYIIHEKSIQFHHLIYPGFLQEVIEGLNEQSENGLIFQNSYRIGVIGGPSYYFRNNPSVIPGYEKEFFMCKSVIEAKEKAILHVIGGK